LDICITKVELSIIDRIAEASGKDKDEPCGVKVMGLEFRGLAFRSI
jgi:hypothetical protein